MQACEAYRRSDFAFFTIRGLKSTEVPNPVIGQLQNIYPDIPFVIGRIGDGSPAATETGLYRQLAQLYADASTNPALTGKHVIVIGASQGGLVAQAFVEMYGDKLPFTIDSLITLASPVDGQFGLPDSWEEYVDLVVWQGDTIILQQITNFLGIKDFPLTDSSSELTIGQALESTTNGAQTRDILDPLRTEIAKLLKDFVRNDWPLVSIVFYNAIGQDLISVANYWKDPTNKTGYQLFNNFLPYINNEVSHADSERYRSNLAKLNRIVFIWAGLDGVVKPPCSGGKLFYKWGSRTDLEKVFTETEQYTQNLLNLRYMFDNGRMFIEPLPYDGHGCISGQGYATMRYHIDAIINGPIAPNDIFEAVQANNLALVQNLVAQNPALVTSRNGFNWGPIYYAGNKLAIAQYLFNQYRTQTRALPVSDQDQLAENAAGSNAVDVLRWLIETLYYNPAAQRSHLIGVANENHCQDVINYLNSVPNNTLHNAVIQNNLALATAMTNANPMIVAQGDASGMLPIFYAGNKLEVAQYLFSVHRIYSPLTPTQLGALLYFAFGSGSLPVARWIIEDLYFDPTSNQQNLISIATNNGQPALATYLRAFLAQGRTSLFTAVIQNNLALVQQIITKNPANAEEWQAGMMPIYYAGNKLEIAQFLYATHLQLGRPLSPDALGTLLYFAFGSGSLPVAQWMIEQLHFNTSPIINDLRAIATANGQGQMITYLNGLGL